MNAIKMPVEAGKQPFSRSMWRVLDDDGDVVARDLSEDVAHQIALALNCHDALVEALEPFAACEVLTPRSIPDSESYLWKPSSTVKDMAGISVAHIKASKAALAKVEDLRKNQQQTA